MSVDAINTQEWLTEEDRMQAVIDWQAERIDELEREIEGWKEQVECLEMELEL